MDAIERKKVSVITKYAVDSFSEGDWYTLGQVTGMLKSITEHPRLLRAMSFGDDDYEGCAAEVLDTILSADTAMIPEVIDQFDIDLWYQQKEPERYHRVFTGSLVTRADFWTEGFLKLFVSHLSSNRVQMSAMKAALANWGISAFIAHEDIEASREWRDEVEAGLETMDVLAAVVEPGFRESDWCSQEVGYGLGRKIDIIPLRAGLDPFGFFGKYQGIQIKGKYPREVAHEIAKLLLKKPKHRRTMLQAMRKAFAGLPSLVKTAQIATLDSWSIVTDDSLKSLIEGVMTTDAERTSLKNVIARVGAFPEPEPAAALPEEDDVPF